MALTRKMLKAMGIEEEKIEQIIEAHAETVDTLKEQRDTFKADADKLSEVQKELGEAKKSLEDAGKDSYKVKYEAVKEEFEKYKTDVKNKEKHTAKEAAYRDMLKAAGISEKRIDSVLKVSDIDSIELDESGKIKGDDKLTESIKTEWADFITAEGTKGANVPTPPAKGGESDPNKMTFAEYKEWRKNN